MKKIIIAKRFVFASAGIYLALAAFSSVATPLAHDTAAEIAAAADAAGRARLVCDFLAGMTDGYAARTYKRLFVADFGSIGDLVG